MKLKTSVGGRAEERPRRRWPLVLLVILIPIAIVLYFWYTTARLPTAPWKPTGALVANGNQQTQNNASNQEGGDPIPAAQDWGDRKEGVYTFLICGTDEDKTRTDTIMVASLDIKNDTLGLISIPRDTYSPSAKRSVKKINGAYNKQDMNIVLDEVAVLIGFRPDYWVLVDYDGFVELIDEIGGVDYELPYDIIAKTGMHQPYNVNLPKGMHHLNGEDALKVARFRKNYAQQDLTRASVQQGLLKAVAKKMLTPASLAKIPQLKDVVTKNVQSDLTWWYMVNFATELAQVNLDTAVTAGVLPTKSKDIKGGAYQILDEEAALQMLNDTVNPHIAPLTKDNITAN